MKALERPGDALYTVFPTVKGRTLCEAHLVLQDDASVLVDVGAAAAETLLVHLAKFRLRSRVAFADYRQSHAMWVMPPGRDAGGAVSGVTRPLATAFNTAAGAVSGAHGACVFPDTRAAALGWRAALPIGESGVSCRAACVDASVRADLCAPRRARTAMPLVGGAVAGSDVPYSAWRCFLGMPEGYVCSPVRRRSRARTVVLVLVYG